MNKKIPFPLALIIIAVLVAVVLGVTTSYRSWKQPEPLAVPQDKTAGWGTYTNNELGFKIKHPDDLFVSEPIVMSTGTGVNFSKKGVGGGDNVVLSVWIGVPYDRYLQRNLTLDEYINHRFSNYRFSDFREGESKRNVKFGVGNYDGIKIYKYKEVGVIKLIPYLFAYVPNDEYGNILEISGNKPTISTDSPKDYDVYEVFDKMLATFKFIGLEGADENYLTLEEVKNTEYYCKPYDETVTLVDGKYVREYPGMASRRETEILNDLIAFGDLNNDGKEDATVVTTSRGGGSGSFEELTVLINNNGVPFYLDSEELGDRIIVNSISIEGGEIVLDMVVHAPGDGLCCPSLKTIKRFELFQGELKQL